jgi:hypothetical protein
MKTLRIKEKLGLVDRNAFAGGAMAIILVVLMILIVPFALIAYFIGAMTAVLCFIAMCIVGIAPGAKLKLYTAMILFVIIVIAYASGVR